MLSKKISKEPGRIGLFLKRNGGAIASVQRGTLEKCETGFCSASFSVNAALNFYEDEIKKSDNWFVKVLQNPTLVERRIEADLVKTEGTKKVFVGFTYGYKAVVLQEKSSTYLNSAKDSQKVSWGKEWALCGTLNAWEFDLRSSRVDLGTRGFYEDRYQSTHKEIAYGVGYSMLTSSHSLFGLEGNYRDRHFESVSEEEEILPTQYRAASAGAYYRYLIPRVVWKNTSETFFLDAGQGRLDISHSLWGKALDTGLFKRGKSGAISQTNFRGSHALETRASRWWLDKIQLGVDLELEFGSGKFSGEPAGPYASMPSGTEYSGRTLTWRIFLGRGVSFQ